MAFETSFRFVRFVFHRKWLRRAGACGVRYPAFLQDSSGRGLGNCGRRLCWGHVRAATRFLSPAAALTKLVVPWLCHHPAGPVWLTPCSVPGLAATLRRPGPWLRDPATSADPRCLPGRTFWSGEPNPSLSSRLDSDKNKLKKKFWWREGYNVRKTNV